MKSDSQYNSTQACHFCSVNGSGSKRFLPIVVHCGNLKDNTTNRECKCGEQLVGVIFRPGIQYIIHDSLTAFLLVNPRPVNGLDVTPFFR